MASISLHPPPSHPPPPTPKAGGESDAQTASKQKQIENLVDVVMSNLAKSASSGTTVPDLRNSIKQQLSQHLLGFQTPNHPPYAWMIRRAIEELQEEGGSSEESISKFIKEEYQFLSWGHASLLRHHLKKLSQWGEIVSPSDNRYILPPFDDELLSSSIQRETNKREAGLSSGIDRAHEMKDGLTEKEILGSEDKTTQRRLQLKATSPRKKSVPSLEGGLRSGMDRPHEMKDGLTEETLGSEGKSERPRLLLKATSPQNKAVPSSEETEGQEQPQGWQTQPNKQQEMDLMRDGIGAEGNEELNQPHMSECERMKCFEKAQDENIQAIEEEKREGQHIVTVQLEKKHPLQSTTIGGSNPTEQENGITEVLGDMHERQEGHCNMEIDHENQADVAVVEQNALLQNNESETMEEQHGENAYDRLDEHDEPMEEHASECERIKCFEKAQDKNIQATEGEKREGQQIMTVQLEEKYPPQCTTIGGSNPTEQENGITKVQGEMREQQDGDCDLVMDHENQAEKQENEIIVLQGDMQRDGDCNLEIDHENQAEKHENEIIKLQGDMHEQQDGHCNLEIDHENQAEKQADVVVVEENVLLQSKDSDTMEEQHGENADGKLNEHDKTMEQPVAIVEVQILQDRQSEVLGRQLKMLETEIVGMEEFTKHRSQQNERNHKNGSPQDPLVESRNGSADSSLLNEQLYKKGTETVLITSSQNSVKNALQLPSKEKCLELLQRANEIEGHLIEILKSFSTRDLSTEVGQQNLLEGRDYRPSGDLLLRSDSVQRTKFSACHCQQREICTQGTKLNMDSQEKAELSNSKRPLELEATLLQDQFQREEKRARLSEQHDVPRMMEVEQRALDIDVTAAQSSLPESTIVDASLNVPLVDLGKLENVNTAKVSTNKCHTEICCQGKPNESQSGTTVHAQLMALQDKHAAPSEILNYGKPPRISTSLKEAHALSELKGDKQPQVPAEGHEMMQAADKTDRLFQPQVQNLGQQCQKTPQPQRREVSMLGGVEAFTPMMKLVSPQSRQASPLGNRVSESLASSVSSFVVGLPVPGHDELMQSKQHRLFQSSLYKNKLRQRPFGPAQAGPAAVQISDALSADLLPVNPEMAATALVQPQTGFQERIPGKRRGRPPKLRLDENGSDGKPSAHENHQVLQVQMGAPPGSIVIQGMHPPPPLGKHPQKRRRGRPPKEKRNGSCVDLNVGLAGLDTTLEAKRGSLDGCNNEGVPSTVGG